MNPLSSSLLHKVWKDLGDPATMWQIGAIVFSLVAGWLLARWTHRRLAAMEVGERGARLQKNSFGRFLTTLFSLVLVLILKLVLAQWHSVNLLQVALSLMIAMSLIRFLFFLLQPIIAGAGRAGHFLHMMERAFSALVLAWFALYVTGILPILIQFLDGTVITIGVKEVSIMAIAQAIVSVVVLLLVALWGAAIVEQRLMRMESFHSSFRVVLARLVRALLVLVAVLFSLSVVGIDLTVLSVFGGALGVGLGFGLQKIASNYISGFIILIDRSLEIGDMIEVGQHYGEVTRINTRYSILRGLDGVESVIPNEMLVSGAVKNYSLTDRNIWIYVDVTVSYQTDVEPLLKLLEDVVSKVPRVSSISSPSAYLFNFGADGLELRIGYYISDPENGSWTVRSNVNRAIWKTLQEHQVEIPYPQRVIRFLNEPPTQFQPQRNVAAEFDEQQTSRPVSQAPQTGGDRVT